MSPQCRLSIWNYRSSKIFCTYFMNFKQCHVIVQFFVYSLYVLKVQLTFIPLILYVSKKHLGTLELWRNYGYGWFCLTSQNFQNKDFCTKVPLWFVHWGPIYVPQGQVLLKFKLKKKSLFPPELSPRIEWILVWTKSCRDVVF